MTANNMKYDVTKYGIQPNENTLITQKLQTLIEQVFAQGGGVIYFPKGEYVLSTVFLRSGIKIEIDKEAKILGAESFYDYAPEEKLDYRLYQDSSHSYFHCSMFVAIDCEDVAIFGEGTIDMRSVWDEDNVRKIVHRGPKCIALKNCKRVVISHLTILNATDLAVYFAGCEEVEIAYLKMRVYIDGISPDCSKRVNIHDCEVECGDDGIVFKSSYTLNRLDICEDITVKNCRVKSRCNAIKFGTESNGGFKNIAISDCEVKESRITGIAVESVDGAIIENISFKNICMQNVGSPIFVHVGKRLRAPEGTKVGKIRNISFENITANGPYVPYPAIAWNYDSFVKKDEWQTPWWYPNIIKLTDRLPPEEHRQTDWQITSNVCGLEDSYLENISFRNVSFSLAGGCKTQPPAVKTLPYAYPEVFVYGSHLPAKGIYFRCINGLMLENVTIQTEREDVREDFVFDMVSGLEQR